MPEGDRLWQLVEAGISLASESSLAELLPVIPAAGAALTDARFAALGVLDEQRSRLAAWITHGLDDEALRQLGPPPRGRGILGELIRDPRPLRLADLHYDLRSVGFPPGHPAMSSFLGVPIVVAGVPYANLYLTEKSAGEFTQEDEDLAVALAALAATAIERAGSYGAAHRRLRQLECLNEVALEVASGHGSARVLATACRGLTELTDADVSLLDEQTAEARGGSTQTPRRIVVPLLANGERRGALAASRAADAPALTDDDRRLVESFAALAAVALALELSAPSAEVVTSTEAPEPPA